MEVGKGLRASTGSSVITADVKCLQRDGGVGGQRQLLSLCTLNHTHTCVRTLALLAIAVLETPQALQCVCVFVLQLAARTSGSD